MTRLSVGLCLFVFLAASVLRAQCAVSDFFSMPLPELASDPVRAALVLAYPDVVISADGQSAVVGNSDPVPFAAPPGRSPQERLLDATVLEQFHDRYPLDFDISHREAPWFDPGRARSDAFFQALWFTDQQAAEASVVRVREPRLGGVTFRVTAKRNVACQLAAVLDLLAVGRPDLSFVFAAPGGGFKWRAIAGTDRLSAHSFGIAIDVNAELGRYWKWTGAVEGRVGAYDNRIPPQVVRAFERYGFIWGGKWHHFDGMHFEFRPELILHARLVAGDRE